MLPLWEKNGPISIESDEFIWSCDRVQIGPSSIEEYRVRMPDPLQKFRYLKRCFLYSCWKPTVCLPKVVDSNSPLNKPAMHIIITSVKKDGNIERNKNKEENTQLEKADQLAGTWTHEHTVYTWASHKFYNILDMC